MDTIPSVGMIGLGNMGGRVARRIRDLGATITGYDVSAAQRSASGLKTVDSVEGVVRGADVVVLCLPNSSVIEKVILDSGGVLEHVTAGQTVVDLSTASPGSTVRLAAALAERGVGMVDSGLTGGVDSATSGTMTLMVGGAPADIERARPVLELFSSGLFHMGPSGAGHMAKVLNNFLNGVALAATAEALVIGKKAGLDLRQLLEVFNRGSAVNWATRERFPHIIKGDYMEGGLTVDLMIKDIGLYLDAARATQAPSIVGAATFSSFQVASSLGYGDVISNHVVDALGDLAGGVRLGASV